MSELVMGGMIALVVVVLYLGLVVCISLTAGGGSQKERGGGHGR